jgi:hypothetical protein
MAWEIGRKGGNRNPDLHWVLRDGEWKAVVTICRRLCMAGRRSPTHPIYSSAGIGTVARALERQKRPEGGKRAHLMEEGMRRLGAIALIRVLIL